MAVALTLTPGCNCQPNTGQQECSQSVMQQAENEVDGGLQGNTSCTSDSDCVLVPAPCEVFNNPCGFDFWAVNEGSQAAVEHAFSVIGAEVCGTCTPEPDDTADGEGDGTDECQASSTPAAVCQAGQCAVQAAIPDGGVFEWACGFSCPLQGEYCDVSADLQDCTANGTYYTLPMDGGSCLSLTGSFGSSFCQADTDCALGQNCQGANPQTGSSGACVSACPTDIVQPTSCDGGCQLTNDNHGCSICYCPGGCPSGG